MSFPRFGMKLAVPTLVGAALLAGGATSASAASSCQLRSSNGTPIKHVVHIVFDNVHLRRDVPNVPSDLEQIPNLLNFLQGNGVVTGNHHTPLISHTATDLLTVQTGLYGDRMGIPVSNAYGFYHADGSVGFQSSFLYWTGLSGDGKPEMLSETGKIAPAPWATFTRAGCDVGGFSVANIEFETIPGDVNSVFGANSPEGIEANNVAVRDKANADFLGVAVHCAQNSPLCNNDHARPDVLPDEPGGYTNFKALFGNFHVQPVISKSGPIKDLDGNVIQTAAGNPGFPNTFNPTATQSLGYAAQMLEAGVDVVYAYVADVHDNRSGSGTFGPGEAGYVAQTKQYDVAFGKFFTRLAAAGITKENTLFIVAPDENDHFAGGTPTPANCDGINTPCTYPAPQKGEININLNRLMLTQRNNTTPFSIHNDDAPTVYLTGSTAHPFGPAQTDPVTRTFARDLDALVATNPRTGNSDKLSALLADQAEMKMLHMVTSNPARTPTFTMFGNEEYFFQTANGGVCAQPTDCVFVGSGFAWNHGDFQQDITRTWVGMVGPGVKHLGRFDDVFSDHTDVRPTMLALLSLKDQYVHDGRVVAEWVTDQALPRGIRQARVEYVQLAQVFKQLNAPLGSVGRNSLVLANRSVTGNDQGYNRYLAKMSNLTASRDAIASQMKIALDDAAFGNKPVNIFSEVGLDARGQILIEEVKLLAHGDDPFAKN
jgi:hypothetical protein